MISDGTQTSRKCVYYDLPFESDVISDGTQTLNRFLQVLISFESDVISDGAQTQIYSAKRPLFRH